MSGFVDFDIRGSGLYRFGMNSAKRGDVPARKPKRRHHPVDQVFGVLKLGRSVDAVLDEMRGRRPKPKDSRRRRSLRS